MTNHPNRNWRAKARRQSVAFVEEHDVLWRHLPTDAEALKFRLRETYLAGFEAGRQQNKSRLKNDSDV